MQDKIHIALSPWDLNDVYNRHCATTLASILDNSSRPVVVHLLYESERYNADAARLYRELGDKYSAEIIFHEITLPDWTHESARENVQKYTAGALLRLYLPRVVASEVKKVIYFDCDMVALTDIAQLWDVDIGDHIFGAVLDANRSCTLSYRLNKADKHGINRRNYFNSGLLIMNLEKINQMEVDFTDLLMRMIKDNPDFNYPDQDALNLLFQSKTLFLDAKYNAFVGLRMTDFDLKRELGGCYDGCILHFCGKIKPWNVYSSHADEYYWLYLEKTPWGANVVDFNRWYSSAKNGKKNCIDRLMSTSLNKPLRLAESIVKSMYKEVKKAYDDCLEEMNDYYTDYFKVYFTRSLKGKCVRNARKIRK